MNKTIAMDLGGSFLKFGVGSDGKIDFDSKIPVKNHTKEGIEKLLVTSVKDIIRDNGLEGKLGCIALGTPGCVNNKTGDILGFTPNIPGLLHVNPKTLLENEFNVPVFIENDANLMTFGEASLYDFSKSVLGFTVGTGIGSGFVSGTDIFHGSTYMSMEMGHLTIVPEGEKCKCGKQGCTEVYSSVTGMLNRIKEKKIPEIQNDDLTIYNVLTNLSMNEEVRSVIDDSINVLGVAIANGITILNPEVVLIGGGVLDIESYPFSQLKDVILENIDNVHRNFILIKRAELGNRAALIGGICLGDIFGTKNA